jgi:hypothetical protein
MPGGGVMGRQAVTPGAPSMGFPAQGGPPAQSGPQIFGPQNSAIPPNRSVGPFTGGTSTENMPGGAPGGGSSWDPRSWFRANPGATFQQGQPMGPDVTGGGVNPMSFFAGGNPYARGAIAAAGAMAPTPADTGELPLSLSGARPMHPSSTGAMPGFSGPPARPYTPTPQAPGPIDPSILARQSPGAVLANAPPGNPSDTPRPPRRPKNLGAGPASAAASNPRFSTVQYQVPGSGQGGPLSRSPIYTALNLFGGRS